MSPGGPDPAAPWASARAAPAEAWRPVLDAAAAALGVAGGPWARLPGGEDCAAFAAGADGVVLKILAPGQAPDRERDALTAVALPVATPRALGVAEVAGWTVLALTRLPGERLRAGWDARKPSVRRAALRAVGRVARALGDGPIPPSAPRPPLRDRARARFREADLGAVDLGPDRFLHGDLTDENVFVDADGAVCGVLDFGGSFVGPWLLELVTPALFLVRGEPALLRALCEGAGVPADPDALAAAHLCHPYLDPPRDLRMLGGEGPSDPGALRRAWAALARGA